MNNSGKDIKTIIDELNYIHSNIKELSSVSILCAGYLLHDNTLDLHEFILAIKQIDFICQSYYFNDK